MDPRQLRPASFDTIEAPGILGMVLAYWRNRASGRLPARRDIDPVTLGAELLPHIFLADVIDGGRGFRWRLIGTHIVRFAGTDDTGKDFAVSIAPPMRETILGHYRDVVATRRPSCHHTAFTGRDGRLYHYDRVLMPLASDGATVDMVLGAATFTEPALRRL